MRVGVVAWGKSYLIGGDTLSRKVGIRPKIVICAYLHGKKKVSTRLKGSRREPTAALPESRAWGGEGCVGLTRDLVRSRENNTISSGTTKGKGMTNLGCK